MKIAYVYDALYPEIPGGVQKRIWEVGRRLAGRGHDVHIFGMHCWEGPGTVTRENVTLHGVCSNLAMYREGRRSITGAIRFGMALPAPLAANRFDLIDCQQFPFFSAFSAKAIAVLRRSPLVITWHEVWGEYWYEYLGWYGAFGKATERVVAGLSPHCVAVSELTAGALHTLWGKNCTVIPNGIDRARILSIPPSTNRSDVIYTGRLTREKRVDLLIEAVALLKAEKADIRCMVVGDGPERERLQQMAQEQGVGEQVTFTGFLASYDEMIARMKASRVFAFPSSREGFGIAALEALACGLALVTVDHPQNAAKAFVTAQQGILSELSPPAFADAIRKALSCATQMRPYGIEFTESYDWQKITDLQEAYYIQITR